MIFSYLLKNKYYSLVVLYFFISILIKLFTGIDVTIPCIIHLTTGIHCPGCGLTGATLELLRFNPQGAFEKNPLIFPLIPLFGWFIVSDFMGHSKEN
jgi:hypothetical protein